MSVTNKEKTPTKATPFERYNIYVDALKTNNEKFPSNQFGDLNFTIIAKECGNRRQWFSENAQKVMPDSNGKTLQKIINFDTKTIGTSMVEAKSPETLLSGIADNIRKENGRLRSKLEQANIEREELRIQVQQLKTQLAIRVQESTERFEEIMESGRSFLC